MRIIYRQRPKSNDKATIKSRKEPQARYKDFQIIQFSTASHSIPSEAGALGVPHSDRTPGHARFQLSRPPDSTKPQQIPLKIYWRSGAIFTLCRGERAIRSDTQFTASAYFVSSG